MAQTSAEVIVVADADVWCPTKVAVDAVVCGAVEWAYPHRGIRRLTESATLLVLTGRLEPAAAAGQHLQETPTRAHPGGGVVVVRRETYESVPLDPRFESWGHEDDSFGWALETLAGAPARGRERLIHLWHPPQPRRSRQRGSEASYDLQERYWAAYGKPTAMRALVDEARKEVVA